jgi:hypothetical protein
VDLVRLLDLTRTPATGCEQPVVKVGCCTEAGDAPGWQGDEEPEYREYSGDEQRSQAGCSVRRMQPEFRHGLLDSTWDMALIRDEVAAQLKAEFAGLVNPVRLVVFSQAMADPESEQVSRLVEELAALDDRLTAEPANFVLDQERVRELGIARTPAVAVLGAEKDYGIRFYGMPSGYEFGTLVDAILDVSAGDSGLSEPTRQALAELARPVHVQVFSTPT